MQTNELTKKYGDRLAADRVSLTVRRGEVYGFLGPNGAGKTTTLRMILGLIRPTSGSAAVLGKQAGTAEVNARIGALIEGPGFYPYLSGRDNLRVMARYRGLPETAVDQALERVDLGSRGGDKFKSYSLGMKQRLGVASALMGDPDLVVLDEPTNGLDPAGMVDMRRLIVDLARGGQTVLLSSHLLDEVQEICDRVGVINNGVLLKESTVVGAARRCVAGGPRRAGRPGHRGRDGRGRRRRRPPGRRPDAGRPHAGPRARAGPRAGGRRRAGARGRQRRTNPGGGLLRDDPQRDEQRAGGNPMSAMTNTTTDTMTNTTKAKGGTMTSSIASTRAELLRLRKWPAVWVTIGAWMALTAMFGYLFNYLSYTTGDSSFSNEGVSADSLLAEILPANVAHVLLQGMPMFGGALMLVLGALVAGNGYGWGTWKTVFTQGPSRPSVVVGSLAALTAFVVVHRARDAGAVLRPLPAGRRRRVAGTSRGRPSATSGSRSAPGSW